MDNYDEEVAEGTVETPEEETTEDVEVEEVEEVEEQEQEEEKKEEEVDWKARALKAEQAIIKAKTKPQKEQHVQTKTDTKLSTFDMLALQKSNIETEEDLDEVVRWAGYNQITVAEALKSSIIKATLAEKAEQRKSASAVHTGSSRRATSQVSDERILADAEKGILPESDADLARLTRLRLLRK